MLNFSIIDYVLTSKPEKVVVAVSGGADSMCLAHLLSQWGIQNKIDITALIVDHGLREESSAEALWVQSFLMEKGIKAVILKWEGPKPKSNIQSKARIARYNLLQEYCNLHGIGHLFIGHTLNDQAETVLMRAIRGSGIDGVSGIKPRAKYGKITLLRPLLNTTRAQIEAHLLEVGWTWVNDPSNLSHKYDRIKVRSMLASYAKEFGNALIYKRLSLLAENARRAKSYINKRVDIAWSKYVKIESLNFLTVDNSIYKLHEELRLRLFVRMFKHLNPHLPTPRLNRLTGLVNALKEEGGVVKTLNGCLVIKDSKRTVIMLEIGKNPAVLSLKAGESNYWHNIKIVVGRDSLTAKALGSAGWRYLKSLDYVKPASVPINAIHSLLAIYEGDKLIYVPHINFKDTNIEIDISSL